MSRSSWRAAPNSSAVGGSPPTRSPRHQRSSTPAAAMAPSTARSRSWRPCTSEQTPILTRASFWLAPPEGWLVPTEGPLASSTPLRAHSSRRMSTRGGRHSHPRQNDGSGCAKAMWPCPRIHEHIDGGIAPMCRSGTATPASTNVRRPAPGCARFGASCAATFDARSREPGPFSRSRRGRVLSGARR